MWGIARLRSGRRLVSRPVPLFVSFRLVSGVLGGGGFLVLRLGCIGGGVGKGLD